MESSPHAGRARVPANLARFWLALPAAILFCFALAVLDAFGVTPPDLGWRTTTAMLITAQLVPLLGVLCLPFRRAGLLRGRPARYAAGVAMVLLVSLTGSGVLRAAQESAVIYRPLDWDLREAFWRWSLVFTVGACAWTYIGAKPRGRGPASRRSWVTATAASLVILALVIAPFPLLVARDVLAEGWSPDNTFYRRAVHKALSSDGLWWTVVFVPAWMGRYEAEVLAWRDAANGRVRYLLHGKQPCIDVRGVRRLSEGLDRELAYRCRVARYRRSDGTVVVHAAPDPAASPELAVGHGEVWCTAGAGMARTFVAEILPTHGYVTPDQEFFNQAVARRVLAGGTGP